MNTCLLTIDHDRKVQYWCMLLQSLRRLKSWHELAVFIIMLMNQFWWFWLLLNIWKGRFSRAPPCIFRHTFLSTKLSNLSLKFCFVFACISFVCVCVCYWFVCVCSLLDMISPVWTDFVFVLWPLPGFVCVLVRASMSELCLFESVYSLDWFFILWPLLDYGFIWLFSQVVLPCALICCLCFIFLSSHHLS